MTAQAYFDDGMAALRSADLTAAAASFTKALAADPGHTDARYHLANAYRDLRRLDDAEREMRRVVAARPQDPKVYSALGVILQESGRPADAVAAYAAAMDVDPTYVNAATNWLNAQQYVSGATTAALARSHARWAELHAPAAPVPAFTNARTSNRPLVVGFVSPDLSRHPVGMLSVRLFENLDHALIRPVVFSTRPAAYEDDISRRIAAVTRWTSVFGVSDAALLAHIRSAKVDVLIDMSGHTSHNRLKVFAARGAPVQGSWLGYPGTTGVPAMDFLLTTAMLTPPDAEGAIHERIVTLPRTHACFDPLDMPPLPAPHARTPITFGCFNNPVKISSETLDSFAAILTRVPASRLALRYKTLGAPGAQARMWAAFEARGIARDRIAIAGDAARAEFLSAYGDIDITLDTFPYSGCMTTCEALWMGCPVVAFPGATFVGRQSAGVLSAAGLSELVAPDRTGYEDLAVALAGDPARRANLRTNLRSRVAASSLCDGAGFARDFTHAMQGVWAAYSRAGGP